MKCILTVIALFYLKVCFGQYVSDYLPENNDLEIVTYSMQLVESKNDVFMNELDSIISRTEFSIKGDIIYKYVIIRIEPQPNEVLITINYSQFPGRLQRKPIGCMPFHGKTALIYGDNMDLFVSKRQCNVFSYKDYPVESIFSLEDEVPTWMIRYRKGEWILEEFPDKYYNTKN